MPAMLFAIMARVATNGSQKPHENNTDVVSKPLWAMMTVYLYHARA